MYIFPITTMDLIEKKPNAWISHVKQYQTANNCTYADALKLSKSTYKKATLKAEDLCEEVVDLKSFVDEPSVETEPLAKVAKTPRARKSKAITIIIPKGKKTVKSE
jgi:hypothetical protein